MARPEPQRVKGHQYQWLADGYDLEIGHFKKWQAWWLHGGYSGFLFFSAVVPTDGHNALKPHCFKDPLRSQLH